MTAGADVPRGIEMIILIGDRTSKRTEYFLKAAWSRADVRLITWEELLNKGAEGFSPETNELQGAVIKIEPPSYKIIEFSEMEKEIFSYLKILGKMEGLPCRFLNHPRAIGEALDKRIVKKRLMEHEISTTKMLMERVDDFPALLDFMRKERCHNVFLKPVYFSGAAGVTAFRINPTGKEVKMKLYTSAFIKEGKLCNSKQIFAMEEPQEIREFLKMLFTMDIIVEKWYPKASVSLQGQKMSYDLRVVYQFGHIAHIVARLAKGPITNLHLNNRGESMESIGLSQEKTAEIEKLCGLAMALFPGLSTAGIDIMLDKGSEKPRIIEINGQGDLIYQDIFNENRIYKEQVERLSGGLF